MQPHLHIFSHLTVPRSAFHAKTALQSGSGGVHRTRPADRTSASALARRSSAWAVADRRGLRAGARAAYDPPAGRIRPPAKKDSSVAFRPKPSPTCPCDRSRAGGDRLAARSSGAGGLRLILGAGHLGRPRHRRARRRAALCGRDRAPDRRPADGRAGGRTGAHPSGRPLPAPAGRPAGPRLTRPKLQARRGALAGAARRRVRHLARLIRRAAVACTAGAAGRLIDDRFPVRRRRGRGGPGGDRAGYLKRSKGALVPERSGQARERACGQLPRLLLPGGLRRAGVGHRAPLCCDRQRSGDARRHRHRARRSLAGARQRLSGPAGLRARSGARAPVLQPGELDELCRHVAGRPTGRAGGRAGAAGRRARSERLGRAERQLDRLGRRHARASHRRPRRTALLQRPRCAHPRATARRILAGSGFLATSPAPSPRTCRACAVCCRSQAPVRKLPRQAR